MHDEQAINATNAQRIAILEKQCEDATASAASAAFSKFSQQEFKDLDIQINQEHHELLTEFFNTLNDIMETHVAFGKMYVTLEEQTDKRHQDYKAYEDIVDWNMYIKDQLEDITILINFQLKKVRAVLRAWIDLNEMITDTIQKARAIC